MTNKQTKEALRVFLKEHSDESFNPQQLEEALSLPKGVAYGLLREMAKEKLVKKVFPEKNKRAYFQYW